MGIHVSPEAEAERSLPWPQNVPLDDGYRTFSSVAAARRAGDVTTSLHVGHELSL